MKRRKSKVRLKYGSVLVLVLSVAFLVFLGTYLLSKKDIDKNIYMINIVNTSFNDSKEKLSKYNLEISTSYEYSDEVPKGNIISQSIPLGEIINSHDELLLVISKGKLDLEKLKNDKINEVGNVPIMMYHGIINKKDSETSYTGGNVDKDGYNRTVESFRRDLEFYYSKGYRMIKLSDYVHGNIDVEYGYSPIILTFDDGNPNNMKVLGKSDNGELIIDENSAVGVLEEFKKKYPDYNVTATFFVNDYLFQQESYNEEILKWLVKHGYTIGNHTKGHANFSNINTDKTQEVVGYVYQELESILGSDYLHIVALPFGSPYNKNHANYPYILKGSYNGIEYETESALRVGWEPDYSPFHKDFDKTFLKRCRAYDNNGKEFDIEMVFKINENKKYISDGDANTIVVSSDKKDLVNNIYDKELIVY